MQRVESVASDVSHIVHCVRAWEVPSLHYRID